MVEILSLKEEMKELQEVLAEIKSKKKDMSENVITDKLQIETEKINKNLERLKVKQQLKNL